MARHKGFVLRKENSVACVTVLPRAACTMRVGMAVPSCVYSRDTWAFSPPLGTVTYKLSGLPLQLTRHLFRRRKKLRPGNTVLKKKKTKTSKVTQGGLVCVKHRQAVNDTRQAKWLLLAKC